MPTVIIAHIINMTKVKTSENILYCGFSSKMIIPNNSYVTPAIYRVSIK